MHSSQSSSEPLDCPYQSRVPIGFLGSPTLNPNRKMNPESSKPGIVAVVVAWLPGTVVWASGHKAAAIGVEALRFRAFRV